MPVKQLQHNRHSPQHTSLTSSLSGCWNRTTGLFRDGSRTPVSHRSCNIRAKITARDPHFSPFLPCSAMLQNSQAPHTGTLLIRPVICALSWHCDSSVRDGVQLPPPTPAHRAKSSSLRSMSKYRIQILAMRSVIPSEEFHSLRKALDHGLKPLDNLTVTCIGRPVLFDRARLGLPFCKSKGKTWA
jgi:hypothetical protein